jgi:hypothetical protein
MKAMILGATGLLGKALMREWSGDKLVGLDRISGLCSSMTGSKRHDLSRFSQNYRKTL